MEFFTQVFPKGSSTEASETIVVTSVAKRPHAIVLILGNMAETQMAEYAQVYQARKCSTICASSSSTSNDQNVAVTACRECARLVRMAEFSEMALGSVSVVLHVLGNGGAQLLVEIQQRLDEVKIGPDDENVDRVSSPCRRAGMLKSSKSVRSFFDQPPKPECDPGSNRRRELMARTIRSCRASTRSLISDASASWDDCDNEETRDDLNTGPRGLILAPIRENMKALPKVNTKLPRSPVCVTSPFHCGPQDVDEETEYKTFPIRPSQLSRLQTACYGKPSMASSSKAERMFFSSRPSTKVQRVDLERCGLVSAGMPKYNEDERAYQRDLETVKSRLAMGTIAFDSAPYVPARSEFQQAVAHLKGMVQSSSKDGWQNLLLTPHQSRQTNQDDDAFWTRILALHSLTKRFAFCYSQTDTICPIKCIAPLMKHYRDKGAHVAEQQVLYSPHLRHLHRNPTTYGHFCDRIVNNLQGRNLLQDPKDVDWLRRNEEEESFECPAVAEHQPQQYLVEVGTEMIYV